MRLFLCFLSLSVSNYTIAGILNVKMENKLETSKSYNGFTLPAGEKLENTIGIDLNAYQSGDFGNDIEFGTSLITNKLLKKQGINLSIENNVLKLKDQSSEIVFGNIEYSDLEKNSATVPSTQKCKKFMLTSRECYGDIKLSSLNSGVEVEVEVLAVKNQARKTEGFIKGGYIGGMEFESSRNVCFTRYSEEQELNIIVSDKLNNTSISFEVKGIDLRSSIKYVNCYEEK